MFENLVECAKTKKTNKKWAFFLATSVIWSVLLLSAIAGGIFFYDAHLDEQLSLVTMLAPPPPPPPPPPAGRMNTEVKVQQTTTHILPDNVAVKDVPTEIKTPTEKKVVFADNNAVGNAGFDGGALDGVEGGVVGGKTDGLIGSPGSVDSDNVRIIPPPPPVEPAEPPAKPMIVRRSEGVIRGITVTQVKPDYPPIARTAHVSGDVLVEITINEEGNVVGARVLGGPPLLQQSALNAARQWKFNPTLLNNAAVKVQGVLTFRFTL